MVKAKDYAGQEREGEWASRQGRGEERSRDPEGRATDLGRVQGVTGQLSKRHISVAGCAMPNWRRADG